MSEKQKDRTRGALTVALCLVLTGLVWAVPPSLGKPVADFDFVERSGQKVSLSDLKGKVWVADFIFTRCPDACWTMTQTLVGLRPLLKTHPNVRFVSYTIDPAFDTPPVLVNYAHKAGADSPQWLFLTAPMADIARVAHSFLLATLTPDSDLLTHSTNFALVDGDGIIRGYYDVDDPACARTLGRDIVKYADPGRGTTTGRQSL